MQEEHGEADELVMEKYFVVGLGSKALDKK